MAGSREAVTWKKVSLATAALTEKATAFRRGLDTAVLTKTVEAGERPELFDLGLAHELYTALLGPVLGAAATVTSPELVFSSIALVIALLGVWALAMPASPPGQANTLRELAAAARHGRARSQATCRIADCGSRDRA